MSNSLSLASIRNSLIRQVGALASDEIHRGVCVCDFACTRCEARAQPARTGTCLHGTSMFWVLGLSSCLTSKCYLWIHLACSASGTTASAVEACDLSDSLSTMVHALQEDTIIFTFIERAQFAKNDAVYTPGAIPVPGMEQPQGLSLIMTDVAAVTLCLWWCTYPL